jgi:hypothetical protein
MNFSLVRSRIQHGQCLQKSDDMQTGSQLNLNRQPYRGPVGPA